MFLWYLYLKFKHTLLTKFLGNNKQAVRSFLPNCSLILYSDREADGMTWFCFRNCLMSAWAYEAVLYQVSIIYLNFTVCDWQLLSGFSGRERSFLILVISNALTRESFACIIWLINNLFPTLSGGKKTMFFGTGKTHSSFSQQGVWRWVGSPSYAHLFPHVL